MRTLPYTLLPCVGPGETPTEGSVADLLRAIPYLLIKGLIPPRFLINETLQKGLDDAGMSGGCRWEPFTLSEAEFEEVVADLEARGDREGRPLRYEEPPEWVTTRTRWSVWTSHRIYSIPIEENLRLQEAMDVEDRAMREASERGDKEARIDHLLRLSALSGEWNEFFRQHRVPPFGELLEEDEG